MKDYYESELMEAGVDEVVLHNVIYGSASAVI